MDKMSCTGIVKSDYLYTVRLREVKSRGHFLKWFRMLKRSYRLLEA